MYSILIPFLFLIFAMILQGITHAILYSGKTENSFTWNEHIIFNLERINWGLIGLSGVLQGYIIQYSSGGVKVCWIEILINGAFLFVACMLSLSFWHNGAYGVTLFKILTREAKFWETVKMWGYFSPHDSAQNKYDFQSRLLLFLLACIIIAIRIITF